MTDVVGFILISVFTFYNDNFALLEAQSSFNLGSSGKLIGSGHSWPDNTLVFNEVSKEEKASLLA